MVIIKAQVVLAYKTRWATASVAVTGSRLEIPDLPLGSCHGSNLPD